MSLSDSNKKLPQRNVSSFDLELNPFEQSFASTKKPVISNIASGGATPTLPTLSNSTTPNIPLQDIISSEQRKQFLLPQRNGPPPSLHSPPVLISPGGSKRLPPLLLSPSLIQQTNTTPHIKTLSNTPPIPATQQAQSNETLQTPGFFLNMSKTGLTPNESSLRTGLTPHFQQHSQTTFSPFPSLHNKLPPATTASALTPGLSSSLGMPSGLSPSLPKNNDKDDTTVKTTTNKRKSKSKESGPSQSKKIKNEIEQPSSLDHSSDNESKKRQEFLERNRLAASKFRQRKKQYIKRIELDLDFYTAEYKELTSLVDNLVGTPNSSTNAKVDIPLLSSLENAAKSNDTLSALAILGKINAIVQNTQYVARNGKNPRLLHENDTPPPHTTSRKQSNKKQ